MRRRRRCRSVRPLPLPAGFRTFASNTLQPAPAKSAFRRSARTPGNNPVETLAVEVDNPDHIAETANRFLSHRLPDIAFVQLCIAHKCDEAAGVHRIFSPMQLGVLARQRGIDRGNCSKPNRSGREIDRIRVFGTTWIRLQTLVLAQRGQIVLVEIPEQILGRVINGRGMRFYGNPVARPQEVEIEGSDDGADRSGRRLVSADLGFFGAWPYVVCIMDHLGRQPEHPAFDCL